MICGGLRAPPPPPGSGGRRTGGRSLGRPYHDSRHPVPRAMVVTLDAIKLWEQPFQTAKKTRWYLQHIPRLTYPYPSQQCLPTGATIGPCVGMPKSLAWAGPGKAPSLVGVCNVGPRSSSGLLNPRRTGGGGYFLPPPPSRSSAISPEVTYGSSPNFQYLPNHQFYTS